MEKNRKPLFIAIFIILVLGIGGYFFNRYLETKKAQGPRFTYETRAQRMTETCPGKTETYDMLEARVMEPLLSKGKPFKVTMNYYMCNKLKRDDWVYYFLSKDLAPVVRRVVAIEGDTFKLVKDLKRSNWNLEVNGKLVLGADEKPFYFGSLQANPTLSLYEKSQKGILTKQQLIIFGTTAPSQMDSTQFGVYGEDGILGKVEIPGKVETPK